MYYILFGFSKLQYLCCPSDVYKYEFYCCLNVIPHNGLYIYIYVYTRLVNALMFVSMCCVMGSYIIEPKKLYSYKKKYYQK